MGKSYPKAEKLKEKKILEQLFQEGKSVTQYPIKLLYLPLDSPCLVPLKAGVAVPKRLFKLAVERNRIKRLLREVYRKQKKFVLDRTDGPYALLFLYIGKEMPTFQQLDKIQKKVLEKFLRKIEHAKETS